MKNACLTLLLAISLFSCGDNNTPDVSKINIDVQVKRFEQDFFALDTINMMASLEQLGVKYPVFLGDFLFNIMQLPPITDTSLAIHALLKQYLIDYKPLKDSADKTFSDFDASVDEIMKGLQFVKYYFPQFTPPQQIITYIGPLEGYSDVITRNALAIGLQHHLGKNFSYYTSTIGQQVLPQYRSRWFTKETIPVNSLKNVVTDLAPVVRAGRPLVEQMAEAGKIMYVLDKVMPNVHDTLKLGYTKRQLDYCNNSEGGIWNLLLTNNLLFTTEKSITDGFMNEGPFTRELGEGSPGAIGNYVGWQMVKKYMEKNSKLSLPELMKTDGKTIFEESKYKPN